LLTERREGNGHQAHMVAVGPERFRWNGPCVDVGLLCGSGRELRGRVQPVDYEGGRPRTRRESVGVVLHLLRSGYDTQDELHELTGTDNRNGCEEDVLVEHGPAGCEPTHDGRHEAVLRHWCSHCSGEHQGRFPARNRTVTT